MNLSLSTQSGKENVFYLILSIFVLCASVATGLELYWVWAIPAVLVVVGVALFKLDWLLLAIVFFTPLSQNLEHLEFGLGVYLPTEPLMFGAMVIFLGKVAYDWNFDTAVLRHPLSIAILLNLVWIFICIFPSALPIVSLKFFVSRLWFVVPFYFVASQMFKNPKNIDRFFWAYIIPLGGVIIWTVINHAIRGFEAKPAHWVMQPFYKDHTSYGALVAFYIPIILMYLWIKNIRVTAKIQFFLVLLLFTVGVIFSYTRAAWVSLLGALGVWAVIHFKVHIRYLIMAGCFGLFMFFNLQTEIIQKLEKNRQDSSSDLSEHVESISNVATDASNVERLNRWNAAFSMFKERPVFGHGPGTYMFLYAPYQHSSLLTIISTNFGDGGNAHSEYFGPLAETGVLGLLTFIGLIFMFYYTAIPLYYRIEGQNNRLILMGSILGITTYLIHGFLNNFLDTDKASVPFWGCFAVVVAIDLYQKKIDNTTITE
ncbi:MAG: O-antigen ligase family protein [Flavobacteriales bacterium]|nr:O-antigen ligase family protein [Flavobacteriales bacterium]